MLGLNRPMDRATFAWRGCLLVAFKFEMDRWIVSTFFHRPWRLTDYWQPFGRSERLFSIAPADQRLLLALVVIAIPFVWIGVAFTLRRLKDAGLPPWLVLLFFPPVVNLFFFALLCLLPSAARLARTTEPGADGVSRGPFASAAVALGLTVAVGIGCTLLGTTVLKRYGWGVFVGLPFALGALSVLIDSMPERRTLSRCLSVSCASVVLLGAFLLVLAIEGVLCLFMAFPIGIALGALGGIVGYTVQSAWPRRGRPGSAIALALLFAPLIMAFESIAPAEPPLWAVTSRVEIAAPPAAVWRHVVSFSRLAPPTELLFRCGVAYPIEAVIDGRGVGAVRHCRFSTGEFVEPITHWEEPRRLAFDVAAVPVPLREMTPYRRLNPPHLEGVFASRRGQFLLTETDHGTTILEGTTWYRNRMWPVLYWKPWSDWIIHRIHDRVLRHIKVETEKDGARPAVL